VPAHAGGAPGNQTEATIRSALSQQDEAAQREASPRRMTMADVNLRYTSIVSPIDGVVIERSVDIGQTVAASFRPCPVSYR
jgi:HlyD family secretion protein